MGIVKEGKWRSTHAMARLETRCDHWILVWYKREGREHEMCVCVEWEWWRHWNETSLPPSPGIWIYRPGRAAV